MTRLTGPLLMFLCLPLLCCLSCKSISPDEGNDPPGAVTNLAIYAGLTGETVLLNWDIPVNGNPTIEGYRIKIRTPINDEPLGEFEVSSTSFEHDPIIMTRYTVHAFNGDKEGGT